MTGIAAVHALERLGWRCQIGPQGAAGSDQAAIAAAAEPDSRSGDAITSKRPPCAAGPALTAGSRLG